MRLGQAPSRPSTGDAASDTARVELMEAAGSAASQGACRSSRESRGMKMAWSSAETTIPPPPSHSAALVALLREALPGSGLVEHLARAVLHMVRAEGSPSPGTLGLLQEYTYCYSQLSIAADSIPALADTREAVLGGPCARYLATAVGLHALCTADGGPSYGMREMMTEAGVSSWWLSGRAGVSGGGDPTAGRPGAWALNAPLFALAYGVLHRPPTSGAALAILRRLVGFAVASAQHDTCSMTGPGQSGGGGGSGDGSASGLGFPSGGSGGGRSSTGSGRGGECSTGAGSGGGGAGGDGDGNGGGDPMQPLRPPGLPLSGPERTPVAAIALTLYRQRVPLLPEARRQEAEAEGWRLTVAAVRHTATWAAGHAVQLMASALYADVGRIPDDGTLPPQPPPALAPALSAGLLPCLERLVRRAGQGLAPEAAGGGAGAQPGLRLLTCFLHEYCIAAPYLPWLLAYGSPTEAAALIASMGKLLREKEGAMPLSECEQGLWRDAALMEAAHAAAATLTCLAVWVEDGLKDEHFAATAAAAVAAAAAAGVEVLAAAAAAPASPIAGVAGTAAGAAAVEGPAAQLRRMAALAACEWLPVLSGLVIKAAEKTLPISSGGQQSGGLQMSNRHAVVLQLCMHTCNMWLSFGAMAAQAAGAAAGGSGGAGPTTSSASPAQPAAASGAAAQGAGGGGGLDGRRLRLLAREARVVELLGAGMRLEAHTRDCGMLGRAPGEEEALKLMATRMIDVSFLVAQRYPSAVRLALAGAAAAGLAFPAHCTWSSGAVGRIVRDLPNGVNDSTGGPLVKALVAWERGGRGVLEVDPRRGVLTRAVKFVSGHGLLEVLEEEVQQPSPLRRCSWWRCTNLAGDSEAGLPLRACARCGGAWYCSRDCQAAHWREGHRGECGGTGGQG